MISKDCLYRNLIIFLCFLLVSATGFSCTPRVIYPVPESKRPMPAPYPEPAPLPPSVPDATLPPEPEVIQPPVAEEPKPRMLASLELTQQGKSFIARNQPDSAIGVLERAVALEPSNGQNYFYLAEAWLLKGNTSQALNFNDLAEIHLGSDEKWMQRIIDQRQRIKEWQSSLP
jgi:tetratricopeptide (TPR) repeat protein